MGKRLPSMTYQIQEAMKTLIAFGQSKHAAKEAFKSQYDGSNDIATFMHEFSKGAKIYSIDTFKDYLRVNVQFGNFAKENFKIKDASLLTETHAKAFLRSHVQAGNSKNTLEKYTSALGKLEIALKEKYQKDFSFNLETAVASKVKENLPTKERSGYHPYADKEALLRNINQNPEISDKHKLAINIAAETGIRLHKSICREGIKIAGGNTISTVGKGGRIKDNIKLSENTKNELLRLADNSGNFKLTNKDYKQILSHLETAAKETKQSYEGCHGFRHNYSLERLEKLQREGKSLKEAYNDERYIRSLDHNRPLSCYRRG